MKRRLNNHDYKGFYWHARQNKMENLQSIREVYCGHEGNGIVSFEILPDIIPVEQGDLIFIEDTLETSLSHVFQVYPSFTWEVKGYEEKELEDLKTKGEKKTQIHGGGMGCAFIKTGVFNEIKYPYYDWVNYADNNRGMLSEDLFFCEKCKNAGIPIFTDVRVGCGHVLRRVQWP